MEPSPSKEDRRPQLRRELGLLSTTMLGMGGAICAGVFVTLGYAASLAGTSLTLVMVICGVINLVTMFSFAELGSAFPYAGGEYTFVKMAYGGLLSFLTGWFEWTSNIFYASFSAVGFGNLISYAIPWVNPALAAIVTIVAFTAINIKGVKETGVTQTILVLILLGILGFFIISGLASIQTNDVIPLTAPQGMLGILRASAFVFVVYLGGEAIVAAQAEIKNPQRTITRAIISSSVALIFIYTLITFVVFRIVTPEALAIQISPLAYVSEQFLGKMGVVAITAAGVIAALTSVNTSIMAQSRVAYAMARDGYFPSWCFNLHEEFSTPHIALILGSMIAASAATIGGIYFVTSSTDFGFMMGFIFVNLSILRLRRTMPQVNRPFKVPLFPLTPILGIMTSLLIVIFLEPVTLVVGASMFLSGVVVYKLKLEKRMMVITLS